MILTISMEPKRKFRISPFLHSTFFEYLGNVIYDGVWVGNSSEVKNVEGIRKDVIDGCIEAGITAVRWPGGCCADHYHWKDGIGPNRSNRIHPIPTTSKIWRHDFGTDEFITFCRLVGAEPIIVVNTATGIPEDFLDWYEYCNGPCETKYGWLRAKYGHKEPYNVRYWGIGNTDENVWWIDFNNPIAYAQNYMRYSTVVRDLRSNLHFIGLGLSERHNIPCWVEKCLDHITGMQSRRAPDSLSVHHYIGGAKGRYLACGDAVNYSDDAYYFTINSLIAYQKDIDLHREYIKKHTPSESKTTISFDEWGLEHPEATLENGIRQRQTMRDAIFAACALHLFYRNSDIVEFAMETQLSNIAQSLFETDGTKFYKTPTFYAMKLLKEHRGQYLTDISTDIPNNMLDIISSISPDNNKLVISLVNKDLYKAIPVSLKLPASCRWNLVHSDMIFTNNVRNYNTFDTPDLISSHPLRLSQNLHGEIPAHSIVRTVFIRTVK